MNSIGSYFELNTKIFLNEDSENSIFNWNKNEEYKYKKYFNSGRSAIRYLFKYILKIKKEEKILIPSYLCDSIIHALDYEDINFEFYSIDENLNIDMQDLKCKINDNVKAIFFIQYFGFAQPNRIIEELKYIKKSGIKLIEDLTQSMFSKNSNIGFGDYIIVSMRKWLEISDGAMLASEKEFKDVDVDNCDYEFINNYLIAQILKYTAIKENVDFNCRNKVSNAENILNIDKKIRNISDISISILRKFDLDKLKQRNINYKYLYCKLSKIKEIHCLYKYDEYSIPLGFPIKTKRRDELLKFLINCRIYCPIHWPIDKSIINEFPMLKGLSENIITIPCDQRYTEKNMKYIVDRIKQFYLN